MLSMLKKYYPFVIFLIASIFPFWINVSDVSVDGVLNLRDFDTPVEIAYDLYVRFFTWYSNWGLGMANHGLFVLLNKSLVFYLFGLLHIPLIYIEKIYLALVLFLLGCGSYYFITRYYVLKSARAVGLLSGLFYMFSVPVFTRLLGVPHILISIALWPVLFVLLLKVVYSKNRIELIKYSAYFAIVGAFGLSADISLNLIYTIAIITLLVWHIIVDRRTICFKRATFGVVLVFILTVFVSFWWCVPILFGIFDGSLVEGNIAHSHNAVVFIGADNTVSLFDNIRLHWTKSGFGLLAPDGTPYFRPSYIVNYYDSAISYVVFLLFFGVSVLIAFINRANKHRIYIISLIGIIATFFSLGTHFPIFGEIHRYLFYNLPGFQALRNFHKFQYLILIWYTSLFAFLCDYLFYRFRGAKIKSALIFLIMIGFIVQSGLPYTAKDLAGRHEYFVVPDYYKEARAWLDAENKEPYRVLVMPQGTWEETYDWGPKFELVPLHRNFFKNSTLILQEPDDVKALIKPIEEDNVGDLKAYLQLMNVRYVMVRKDIYKANLTERNRDLINELPHRLQEEGIKHAKSFGKLDFYKIPESHVVPQIYPATVNFTMVVGKTDSLVPLSHADYIDGRRPLAISGQQNEDLFKSLASGLDSKSEGSVLFVNGEFPGQVLEFIKNSSLRGDASGEVDSVNSVFVELDEEANATVSVKEEGKYEVWIRSRTGVGLAKEADVVLIDGGYYAPKADTVSRWLRVGVLKLTKGKHSVSVGRDWKEPAGHLGVMVVPEKRLEEYQRLFSGMDKRFLFHIAKGAGSDIVGATARLDRNFYIDRAGEYDISALANPKMYDASAYALREVFDGSTLGDWVFRQGAGQQASSKLEWPEALTPVFMFGENFSPPRALLYPSLDGVWRGIKSRAAILIFNPGNKAVRADISFSIASHRRERNISVTLGSKLLGEFSIDGPDTEQSRTSTIEVFFGEPYRAEFEGVVLVPGINRMHIRSDTAPELLEGETFVAIAVMGDDFRVVTTESPAAKVSFRNSKNFGWSTSENGLELKDGNAGEGDGLSWVTRRIDSIDLYDYPIVRVDYMWPENSIQTMELGFRIDTDGDARADRVITRSLEEAMYVHNRFELDLREAFFDAFGQTEKMVLVGIDFFPHKRWNTDWQHETDGVEQRYIIKEVSVVSKKASMVMAQDSDTFKGVELPPDVVSNKENLKDGSGLTVSFPLGGQNGYTKKVEFTVPLNEELRDKASHLLLPFKISNSKVQSVKVMIGLDTSGDGYVNRYVPAGKRVLLDRWKPLDKWVLEHGEQISETVVKGEKSEESRLYRWNLPWNLPINHIVSNWESSDPTIMRSGTPLDFVRDVDGELLEDQFSFARGGLITRLPLGVTPDGLPHYLYYVPDEWIKSSPRFAGFSRYAINLDELKRNMQNNGGEPVGLKFILTGTLPYKPNKRGDIEKDKFYNFYVKAPMYATPERIKGSDILTEDGLPELYLDSEKVIFNELRLGKSKDSVELKKRVWLNEGSHELVIKEDGVFELLFAEIKRATAKVDERRGYEPQLPDVTFNKINPTRYVVDIEGAKEPFMLVFSEKFDKGWRAYFREPLVGSGSASEKEPWSALLNWWKDKDRLVEITDHFVVNGYGNGWIMPTELFAGDRASGVSQLVIEYKMQRYFESGILVSAATLLGSLCFIVWVALFRRKRDK